MTKSNDGEAMMSLLKDAKAIALSMEGMNAQRAIPALCMALGLSIDKSVPHLAQADFIKDRVPRLVAGSILALSDIDKQVSADKEAP